MPLKVSIVVPLYNPGPRVARVLDCVDRQTMPAEAFEVIFVGDGSTDGTSDVIEEFRRTRRNVQMRRIPNSGWPSRPRNVGVDMARGTYVLFLDHDDELGDEALERTFDYARRHGSDVVVGKEVAVGRGPLDTDMFKGNIPQADVIRDGLMDLLTVHRLFRHSSCARPEFRR
jgi:glycosyltransferase involved in cell wall biosynthesis